MPNVFYAEKWVHNEKDKPHKYFGKTMWGPLSISTQSNSNSIRGDNTAPSNLTSSSYQRRLSTVESNQRYGKTNRTLDFRNPMMMLSSNI